MHGDKLALAAAKALDNGAHVCFGNINEHLFNGFAFYSVYNFIKHFGLGNLKLVALSAHIFNKHGQVQLTAPGDAEGIGAVGILYAQGDIGLKLTVKAGAKMTAGEVFAFFSVSVLSVDELLSLLPSTYTAPKALYSLKVISIITS